MARPHPLHSITASEISHAAWILTKILKDKNGPEFRFRFKNISISEPPKALLLPYLNAEAAGTPPQLRPYVPRCVDLVWTYDNERNLCESKVSLETQEEVRRVVALPGQHSPLDR